MLLEMNWMTCLFPRRTIIEKRRHIPSESGGSWLDRKYPHNFFLTSAFVNISKVTKINSVKLEKHENFRHQFMINKTERSTDRSVLLCFVEMADFCEKG